MSYEQNKERLSSASRRDGYFSYVSTRDSEVQKTTLLSVDSQRARSCSQCLLTATPSPTAWSQQCKTPPPSVSTTGAPTTCNGKTSASALNWAEGEASDVQGTICRHKLRRIRVVGSW